MVIRLLGIEGVDGVGEVDCVDSTGEGLKE